MPGTAKSMPNTARPVVLAGASTRGSARPTSFSSLSGRSTGLVGTGSAAASRASAAKARRRPLAACTMNEFSLRHCDGGTRQRAAATVISISRAAAPILRMCA